MRQEFELPEGDRDFLESSGAPWEAILSGAQRWLLRYEFAVPPGYGVDKVTVALLIEPTYPETQIDMAYFFPALKPTSGKQVNNLSDQPLDGKVFQRWSRHRTPANPWRPGVDNVGTHLLQVTEWLNRETH